MSAVPDINFSWVFYFATALMRMIFSELVLHWKTRKIINEQTKKNDYNNNSESNKPVTSNLWNMYMNRTDISYILFSSLYSQLTKTKKYMFYKFFLFHSNVIIHISLHAYKSHFSLHLSNPWRHVPLKSTLLSISHLS